ncbi:MAG: hypothetical protein FJ291_12745 [Planctomycetes bacterium]|nr:hypothetical protein [Planctomycetota bacterium]
MTWLMRLIRGTTADRVPVIALLCVSLVAGMIGLVRALHPYDLGFYEGGSWAPSLMAACGRNPYDVRAPLEPPYVMAAYGPLFYCMVGWGLRWFGLQFWSGRLIALVFTLVSMWCVGRLTWRFTGDRGARILSVLLFASQFPVQFWLGAQKADFPALAFGLMGLVLALRPHPVKPPLIPVLLSSLAFAAAFFCRQSTLLPILVAILWLMSVHMYRETALLAGSALGALLIPIYFLNEASSGGFLWQAFRVQSGAPCSLASMVATVRDVASSPVRSRHEITIAT